MQGKTVSRAAAPLLLLPPPNPSCTRYTNSSSHLVLLEDASYVLGKEAAQKAALVLEEHNTPKPALDYLILVLTQVR